MMEWLTIASPVLTLILTCITLWGHISSPVKANKKHMEELDKRLERVEEKAENDWRSFQEQKRINKTLLKTNRAVAAHLLDGNHTKQLQACVDDIDEILYDKGGTV